MPFYYDNDPCVYTPTPYAPIGDFSRVNCASRLPCWPVRGALTAVPHEIRRKAKLGMFFIDTAAIGFKYREYADTGGHENEILLAPGAFEAEDGLRCVPCRACLPAFLYFFFRFRLNGLRSHDNYFCSTGNHRRVVVDHSCAVAYAMGGIRIRSLYPGT